MKRNYMKFLVIITIMTVSSLSSSNAQEVLLGSYEFTTGENQTKPSNVQAGVVLSDIIFTPKSTTVTATYTGDAVETKWNKAINFGNSNCVQFYLKNDKADTGFDVTRITITLKRTGPATKFRVAFGSAVNPNADMYNANDPLIGTTDYVTYNFQENTKDASVTGAVSPVPPVFGGDTVYIAFATVSDPAGSETVTIDKVEVYGYLPKLHVQENFSAYSPIALSQEPVESMKISDDVALAQVPGWTGMNLYAFIAGTAPASAAMFGITATDSAYLTSPVLDLSSPSVVSFKYRSRMGSDINPDGRIKVLVDNNELVWADQSTATTLQNVLTETFIGNSSSKLTFTAPVAEGNQMIIDDIKIYQSFEPGIDLPFNHTVDFGVVNFNAQKSMQLPVKAFNLSTDLTMSFKQGTNFSLGASTITQAAATSGTDISINFTAPAVEGAYTDTLVISHASKSIKQVFVKAVAGDASAVPEVFVGKISISGQKVMLNDLAGKQLQVYNLSGVMIKEIMLTRSTESIIFQSKGVYMLRLRDNQGAVSTKVLIQ